MFVKAWLNWTYQGVMYLLRFAFSPIHITVVEAPKLLMGSKHSVYYVDKGTDRQIQLDLHRTKSKYLCK